MFFKICVLFMISNANGGEIKYDESPDTVSRMKELELKVMASNNNYLQLEEKLLAYVTMNAELLADLKIQRENSIKKDDEIDLLKKQLHDLQQRVVSLETSAQPPYKQPVDELDADFDVLKKADSSINCDAGDANSKRPSRFVLDQGEAVAFHAVVDANGEVRHHGINQNLVFETVLLNINGGYHSQHGLFIAPTAGLYIFSTSVLDAGSKPLIHADMVKNGAVLARAYGHGNSGFPEQGSVTVVTQLKAGDEVWVRISCCADGSITGLRYTSFTGALLMFM
ncbi:cerebellin-4-like [Mercenaria mercenaria]|uniref:cerebellin-4-like n=1 Tax=Mercenaria mercenaria TaxID=6596 RepID=UPI00234F1B3E|nr:cerebellin-4-like [Mercenaria mercenaria]